MTRGILVALFIVKWLTAIGQLQYPPRDPLNFPEHTPYQVFNPLLIPAQLIPIGFSPSGLFAFVIEPADEACGCYFFEMHIRDLQTDRDVYEKRVEIQGTSSLAWDRVWVMHGSEFMAQMAALGIELQTKQQQPFPIPVDGAGSLAVKIRPRYRKSDFGQDERFIDEASVWIGNPQWGEKRIARLKYPNVYVYRLQSGCYLKSPFEDRAAIVLVRTDRGWEGPPNTIHFEVIGAHLRKHFPQGDTLSRP